MLWLYHKTSFSLFLLFWPSYHVLLTPLPRLSHSQPSLPFSTVHTLFMSPKNLLLEQLRGTFPRRTFKPLPSYTCEPDTGDSHHALTMLCLAITIALGCTTYTASTALTATMALSSLFVMPLANPLLSIRYFPSIAVPLPDPSHFQTIIGY